LKETLIIEKAFKERLPIAEALAIRKKHIIKDKKRQAEKYACRKNKGGKDV